MSFLAEFLAFLRVRKKLWLLPLIRKDVPYDTAKDFAPVIEAVDRSMIWV